MTDEKPTREQLTDGELEEVRAEQLPPREQMSLIREPGAPVVPVDGFTIEPIPPEEI